MRFTKCTEFRGAPDADSLFAIAAISFSVSQLIVVLAPLDSLTMASSGSASSSTQNPKKSIGFIANAVKHKHSFIQFFAMTGILMLSVRSLGQKYRLHDLQEDTLALKDERESLTHRMNNIKRSLLHEASLESTGLFASRLRLLFGEED